MLSAAESNFHAKQHTESAEGDLDKLHVAAANLNTKHPEFQWVVMESVDPRGKKTGHYSIKTIKPGQRITKRMRA